MGCAVYILALTFLCLPGLLAKGNNTSKAHAKFRLRGSNRCEGLLEMKQLGTQWRKTDGLYWNLKSGNRVCAELDCGSAISVRRTQLPGHMKTWYLKSDCNISSINKCFRPSWSRSFLTLKCSSSVRLVHGSNMCSGRLEVRSNQSWSSVCEGHFDLHDALVVCSELGCGAPSHLQGMPYGEAEAPLWKMFQCEGNESALLDCGMSVSENCSSGKALGLTCKDSLVARLARGAGRCNGEVQVKQYGLWKDMANVHYDFRHNPWTMKAADVICRQLDCGSALSLVISRASSYPLWEISPSCLEITSTLRDCASPYFISKGSIIFLTCSDSVRLVHGSSRCSGRLEVHSNQSWSSVYEEEFDPKDAEVACRELSCGAPSLLWGWHYGKGEIPVWTSQLQCEGNESVLLDCRRSASAGKNYSSGNLAGLTCTDPGGVRLVGQPSRCAGSLEIQYQGEWRPVLEAYEDWDLKSGSAVCQYLDCGSAVSVKKIADSIKRLSWFVSPLCVKLTSGFRDCVGHDDSYNESSRVQVVCSDLLLQPNISLSVSTDGFSEVYKQGLRLLMGSDFTISCSIQPQYPGGSFQLTSNSLKAQNHIQSAVNHSAHFPLFAVGYVHRGDYVCIYHLDVFNHSFSSPQSPGLYLTVGGNVSRITQTLSHKKTPTMHQSQSHGQESQHFQRAVRQASVRDLIIRVVLTVLGLLIFDVLLFFYYKVSVRRMMNEGRSLRR